MLGRLVQVRSLFRGVGDLIRLACVGPRRFVGGLGRLSFSWRWTEVLQTSGLFLFLYL